LAVAALVGLAACATPPQLTREQWLTETTRVYPDHTPAEILDAAREVFVLADGEDFGFAYPDDRSMIATRPWSIFVLLSATTGSDVWRFWVSDHGIARVNVQSQCTSINQCGPVTTPEVYELFWGRMDYLLGKSEIWETCAGHGGTTWEYANGIEALCSVWNIKDSNPTDPDWQWTSVG
jgi:hypothetical protein